MVMTWHERFNHSGFSRFLNSGSGRAFRITAGLGFLGIGYMFRAHSLGLVSMVWSIFPLTAGGFDVCYISAALGGPLSGARIRERAVGRDGLTSA
jgi:hypothetical protein